MKVSIFVAFLMMIIIDMDMFGVPFHMSQRRLQKARENGGVGDGGGLNKYVHIYSTTLSTILHKYSKSFNSKIHALHTHTHTHTHARTHARTCTHARTRQTHANRHACSMPSSSSSSSSFIYPKSSASFGVIGSGRGGFCCGLRQERISDSVQNQETMLSLKTTLKIPI